MKKPCCAADPPGAPAARAGAGSLPASPPEPPQPSQAIVVGTRICARLPAKASSSDDRQIVAEIGAARPAGPTAALTAAAHEVAEQVVEHVGEAGEVEARARRTAAAAAHPLLERLMAELVVGRLLLGVAQDLVGLVDLLELGLGRLVPGIAVGVILLGHLAKRVLELGLGGRAADDRARRNSHAWPWRRLLSRSSSSSRHDNGPAGTCAPTGPRSSRSKVRPTSCGRRRPPRTRHRPHPRRRTCAARSPPPASPAAAACALYMASPSFIEA